MYYDANIMADWECPLDLKGLFYTPVLLTIPKSGHLEHVSVNANVKTLWHQHLQCFLSRVIVSFCANELAVAPLNKGGK